MNYNSSTSIYNELQNYSMLQVLPSYYNNMGSIPKFADDVLPSLTRGKQWSDYKLTGPKWNIIKLTYNCLKVLVNY